MAGVIFIVGIAALLTAIAVVAWRFHRRIAALEFDRERDRLDYLLRQPVPQRIGIPIPPPGRRRLRALRDTGEHLIITAVAATGTVIDRLRAFVGAHPAETIAVATVTIAGGALLLLPVILPDDDDRANDRPEPVSPTIVTPSPTASASPTPERTAGRRTAGPTAAAEPTITATSTPLPTITMLPPTPLPSSPAPEPTGTETPGPAPSSPAPEPTGTPIPTPTRTITDNCPPDDVPPDDVPPGPPCDPQGEEDADEQDQALAAALLGYLTDRVPALEPLGPLDVLCETSHLTDC